MPHIFIYLFTCYNVLFKMSFPFCLLSSMFELNKKKNLHPINCLFPINPIKRSPSKNLEILKITTLKMLFVIM